MSDRTPARTAGDARLYCFILHVKFDTTSVLTSSRLLYCTIGASTLQFPIEPDASNSWTTQPTILWRLDCSWADFHSSHVWPGAQLHNTPSREEKYL